ncbi:MAG: hypothetical protein A2W93_02965 [Bacteroidetes bacterium GWF2_43_63]|nr:MAG: hypothetical protein A2W94_08965 [Bacteroidetes bacterium GWE2_42_42]OFY53626.1 MAG: hypothetical protein A2W93_02965 [Bacteroidetes bacterium GWF2_43_63]HBG71036.1 hypothetical protein [Bacteroidales bacterium]HCB63614.1 hypothetical protein [Bacteroidales bacterium]HCY24363.1 hypothetical protein [Bacteroidales bacterium]
MKLKLIIQILLGLGILALIYFIYSGIMSPVKFNNEMNTRKDIVIQKMKDIRTMQTMYMSMNGKYCSTFDSLITFVKEGEIPLVKLTARPGDSTFTDPIRDTVGYVSINDSLFGKRPDFKLENLSHIPFSNFENAPYDNFEMKVAIVNKGNVMVNVIEVFAPNKYYLKGLDLEKNNVDPEDGLRFGSLTEPSTDGNWE